jgi:hypothetical protein
MKATPAVPIALRGLQRSPSRARLALFGSTGTAALADFRAPARGRRAERVPAVLCVAAAVLAATLLLGASSALAAAPPIVTVEDASSPSYLTAQVKGTVDPGGEATTYRFQYATQADFSDAVNGIEVIELEGTGPQTVEGELTGLAPNTTYHLRLLAENAESAGVPAEAVAPDTFTTLAVQAPTLTIADAAEVHSTTAKATGTVELAQNDPAFNSSCQFQYATAEDFSNAAQVACEPETVLASEAQPVSVKADLTGLIPGTTYHLRLLAANSGGPAEITAAHTFATEAIEPLIDATYSTAPSKTEVTLQARVNPGGAPTGFHFEYLTAQQYEEDGGSFGAGTVSAPEPDESAGSDFADHTVEAALEGLQPDTAYRYRVVLASEKSPPGATIGPARSFHTASDLAACPQNEQLRRENTSTALPDCRAYELVSPVEKGGLSFLGNVAVTDAGGEHAIVTGGSRNALLSTAVSWMLQTRTPNGWSGVQIGPPPAAGSNFQQQGTVSFNAVSEDFSRFAFQMAMPLDPRDVTHGYSEYVRSGPAGPFNWTTGPPAPALPLTEPGECENGQLESRFCTTNRAIFAGASSDIRDLVWGQYHPLLAPPAALPGSLPDTHEHGYEVYESVGGIPQLTGLVPAGPESQCGPLQGSCVVPPCGAAMGNEAGGEFPHGFAPIAGAVSGSGSQVIFTSPDPSTEGTEGCAPPEIYLREDGTRTLQASASERPSGDPNGPQQKVYAGSSEEGGHIDTIFFTSHEELTEDADTGGADEGNDLYAYTLPAGSQPGQLVDLTPENNTPGPKGAPEVTFLGASNSGKLVYFTASSQLTAEPNAQGQAAQPGSSNLYLYDAATGQTTFIAPGKGLNPPHVGLGYGTARERQLTSQLTPDGSHLVFLSSERLTEYDNAGPECKGKLVDGQPVREPGPCAEVYLYSAAANSYLCVSCDPTGAPPAGSASLPRAVVEGFGPFSSAAPGTLRAPRAISDDGARVFFSSPDRLTAEAPPLTTTRSGVIAIQEWEYEPNAYEYEAGGVHLIAPAAVLLTSTPTGRDVLFDTFGRLTPQDDDNSPDIYDARVDGGFPAPAPTACSGISCQPAPGGAPATAAIGSATFAGSGNVAPRGSNARKLSKALKACRKKKSKTARKRCESEAKQRFGSRASKSRGGK